MLALIIIHLLIICHFLISLIAVTCVPLEHPADGLVEFNGISVGSSAVYYCNDGFILEGTEALVCQEDGRWSDIPPTCVRKS